MIRVPHTSILYSVQFILIICLLGAGNGEVQAQHPDFAGKRLGIYLSTKQVSFTEEYYMWINQFLKVEEDRSWSENVKAELLIRLGEQLSIQLQEITGLDTAIFLNGDLEKARAFLDLYGQGGGNLNTSFRDRLGVDYVLVLQGLQLNTRDSKIVYIRSNRFVTQRIDVKKARLEMALYKEGEPSGTRLTGTCFDDQKSEHPPQLLDIYRDESELGAFFSEVFSAWWLQLVKGVDSNCK